MTPDTEIDASKYQFSCFFIEAVCACGYLCGGVFTPDLLAMGVSEMFECPRCAQQFTIAVTRDSKQQIRDLMELADKRRLMLMAVDIIEQQLKQKMN